jgi:ABC-type glycerol-3-phosphate transport system permease component
MSAAACLVLLRQVGSVANAFTEGQGLTQEEVRHFRRSAKRSAVTERAQLAFLYVLLVAGAALFMVPLYMMLVMSLKSQQEISNSSPFALPLVWRWDNYKFLFTDANLNFLRSFWNTVLLTVPPTIGTTLTCALVAYPFARMQFRGKDRLFIVLLSTMMLPGVVTMIPGYVMFARIGWVDTFWPFIVPAFLGGGAFNIFLVRQFMLGVPREMDEAAKIDGASHARIFWQVLLPNCGPVLATIAVFSFVGGFRVFMEALIMLNDPAKFPLEVTLRSLQSQRGTEWNYLMAGSVIVMVPIVVTFLACQRYFVRGIALTGGK